MTKLAYIILLTLLSCGQSKPLNDHSKERIDAVCDKFMQAFRAGNLSDAMQLLKDNSVIANSTIDTLQMTINEQMKTILSSYGKFDHMNWSQNIRSRILLRGVFTFLNWINTI